MKLCRECARLYSACAATAAPKRGAEGGAGGDGLGQKKARRQKFVFSADALGCTDFPDIREHVIQLYNRVEPMFRTYHTRIIENRVFRTGFEGILQHIVCIFHMPSVSNLRFWARLVSLSCPFRRTQSET
jgi:hypothetical protein